MPATMTASPELIPAVLGKSALVWKLLVKTPLWRNRAPAVNTRMTARAMLPMMYGLRSLKALGEKPGMRQARCERKRPQRHQRYQCSNSISHR